MGYNITNNIDKGWFRLVKNSKVNKSINYYLDKFNVDLDDYLLMKSTGNFRFIDIKDINRWANIMCFKKDRFKKQDIDKWLNLLYKDLKVDCKFFYNPFPPIEILNKIKLVEYNKDYYIDYFFRKRYKNNIGAK